MKLNINNYNINYYSTAVDLYIYILLLLIIKKITKNQKKSKPSKIDFNDKSK